MTNINLIDTNHLKKYIVQDEIKISEVNPIDMNQGLALAFLQPLYNYGKFSTGFSYGLQGFINLQGNLRYYVTRNRIWSMFSTSIYALLCAYQACIVIRYDFRNVSYSKLVNWIKRITFGVFAVKLFILLICLERRGRKQNIWVKVLEQSDIIQEKFAVLGITGPSRNKAKIVGSLICILSFTLCLIHFFVFSLAIGSKWQNIKARHMVATLTLGQWNFKPESSNPIVVTVLAYMGLACSIFSWNIWFLCDCIRVFCSWIVLMVFRKLNSALETEKLTINNLHEIMDLHFNGIKLLNLFNQLLSPITLVSTLFNIMYMCYWASYVLISFELKISHVVGAITVARMIAVFYITADVNTQAYRISTWLENTFAAEYAPPNVDKIKFTLFTSLIYSREAIGFKGMNYFTITHALNSAIAGLVLAYTAVVNQFATH